MMSSVLHIFRRILAEQAADIAALRSRFGLPTIWAGDFNQGVQTGSLVTL